LLADENGTAYSIFVENISVDGDSSGTKTIQTRLCLIDIENMKDKNNLYVAEKEDMLPDEKSIVSGAGNPNEIIISNEVMKIIFALCYPMMDSMNYIETIILHRKHLGMFNNANLG